MVELLSITPNADKLIESIAEISYVTQRFKENKIEKSIRFSSGRVVLWDRVKRKDDIRVGHELVGFTKDDGVVEEIIPPSSHTIVRFLRKIGHWQPFEMCNVTFKLVMSRKAALHLNRYRHISTNMQSQKYLNPIQFEYEFPSKASTTTSEQFRVYRGMMETIQGFYEVLRDDFKWDAEDARLVYPNAASQHEIYHTNFHQLRHIFDILCDEDYVREVHDIGMAMFNLVNKQYPIFFEDYKVKDGSFGYVSAKRDKCSGCNVKVNFSLNDSDKIKIGLK